MSAIEQEILKVTSEGSQGAEESVQKYRARLVRAVSDLEDAEWEELSLDVQDWVNSGVEAIERKELVPAFPEEEPSADDENAEEPELEEEPSADDENAEEPELEEEPLAEDGKEKSESEEEPLAEDEKSEEPEKTKGGGKRKSQPEKTKGGGKRKSQPEKTKGGGKKKSSYELFMEAVVEDPERNRSEILKDLAERGHDLKDSTAQVAQSNVRRVMRMLEDAGRLKD